MRITLLFFFFVIACCGFSVSSSAEIVCRQYNFMEEERIFKSLNWLNVKLSRHGVLNKFITKKVYDPFIEKEKQERARNKTIKGFDFEFTPYIHKNVLRGLSTIGPPSIRPLSSDTLRVEIEFLETVSMILHTDVTVKQLVVSWTKPCLTSPLSLKCMPRLFKIMGGARFHKLKLTMDVKIGMMRCPKQKRFSLKRIKQKCKDLSIAKMGYMIYKKKKNELTSQIFNRMRLLEVSQVNVSFDNMTNYSTKFEGAGPLLDPLVNRYVRVSEEKVNAKQEDYAKVTDFFGKVMKNLINGKLQKKFTKEMNGKCAMYEEASSETIDFKKEMENDQLASELAELQSKEQANEEKRYLSEL